MRSFRSKRPTSQVDGRRSERTAGRSHERALAREAFGLRTQHTVLSGLSVPTVNAKDLAPSRRRPSQVDGRRS
jgi:hypothetical protein